MPTDPEQTSETSATTRKRDSDLLRLYAEQRSEEAFAELRRRYARLIFTTCLREIGNPTLAEDAAQGVLLLLSQKAGSLQRLDTLAGWLYTASRHVARNLLKQERRRQRNETHAMEASQPTVDPGNPLWEQIEPHFHAALNRLKPADRTAILLRYVQDESLAEVGVCLGIPENTARMRINRAMEKIRTYLAQVGITVTIALLATLLEERASSAAPISLTAPLNALTPCSLSRPASHAVRRTSQLLSLLSLRLPLFLLLTVSFFSGIAAYRSRPPRPFSLTEQRQLFLNLRGDWTGTLTYADDATKQQFTMPTGVEIDTQNQENTLRFVATYPKSDREDITTLSGDPRTGVFIADNGGPRSSHRLHSTGELVKLAPNQFAFRGWSFPQNADIRLRLTLQPDRVTLYEEYRKQGQSNYQFRNRFTLERRK